MKKLTDERVVQPWLPLLDEGKFQAPEVSATGEERNWGPYEQIFLFPRIAQGQFRLNKAIMSELVVLAGSAVLPIKYGEARNQYRTWVGNC